MKGLVIIPIDLNHLIKFLPLKFLNNYGCHSIIPHSSLSLFILPLFLTLEVWIPSLTIFPLHWNRFWHCPNYYSLPLIRPFSNCSTRCNNCIHNSFVRNDPFISIVYRHPLLITPDFALFPLRQIIYARLVSIL